jgi:hypothetical protein
LRRAAPIVPHPRHIVARSLPVTDGTRAGCRLEVMACPGDRGNGAPVADPPPAGSTQAMRRTVIVRVRRLAAAALWWRAPQPCATCRAASQSP